ncbi:ubiquinol-cytochrome-c reductase complex assembly factor 1 isoform X1 [Lacerta agilis]|uniref:Ubiquinol-cytochrome c reductase complex assembly factor 1 n=1 Tax=Podarcis muralis TaxID=64176 RepID=A0A670IIL7_PODMU|nr:ubiquinol-cytochrome-c reductase complex assembly factor 1 isoform X2 [Podarcis muralis]XP_033009064.1 ubiquinol-cytochrome-c reductase complex assembly factor 1 isoform X1 [Lacerta agilis]XP_053249789.1 ubiquinol-cytochrome-c reductase complex assembly factor 1 isoform X2 [Podarcis raffonei]
MAALVRVVTHRAGVPQWIALCSGLIQTTLAQQQWGRMLHGTLQRRKNGQSQLTQVCCGLIQTIGTVKQPNRTLHHTNKVFTAKDSPQPSEEKVGAFTKIIEAMGFTGPLKYNKWKIKIAALRMYTCCVEKTDYEEFFNKFQMPDTLNSWFLVAQLHVWMCLVRMKQEGRTGKYMCRYIVHSMWEDVEQRGKVMGIDSVALKTSMRSMTENFYAAIFGYDEGILSDDHVLAAAIWRNLFNKHCEDPRQLEIMVEYIRKQVQHLDAIPGEDLLLSGEVTWRPLVETNAQSIVKPALPTYNDEGL